MQVIVEAACNIEGEEYLVIFSKCFWLPSLPNTGTVIHPEIKDDDLPSLRIVEVVYYESLKSYVLECVDVQNEPEDYKAQSWLDAGWERSYASDVAFKMLERKNEARKEILLKRQVK